MITRGIRVGRVLGSELRMHISWILLLLFLVASLGAIGLPARYPGWPAGLGWAVAVAAGLGLLGGVILHEVAHVVVARRFGVPPGPVMILLFGAPVTLEGGARTPLGEAMIAIAGPAASIVVGVAATGGALFVGGPLASGASGGAATLETAIGETLLSIGVMNGIVGLLNLVPVFPLDGARLVRAAAWRIVGDAARGTRIAVAAGRFVGLAVLFAGLVVVATGDFMDGLVLVVLGWIARGASTALGRRNELEGAVSGVSVAEVMERDLPTVPPQVTLDTFASVIVGPGETTVLPVMAGERLVGLVGHSALRRAGAKAWTTLHAADVMAAIDVLPTVAPGEALRSAIAKLQGSGADGIPVFEDDRLVGVLTRYGVGRTLRRRVTQARGGSTELP